MLLVNVTGRGILLFQFLDKYKTRNSWLSCKSNVVFAKYGRVRIEKKSLWPNISLIRNLLKYNLFGTLFQTSWVRYPAEKSDQIATASRRSRRHKYSTELATFGYKEKSEVNPCIGSSKISSTEIIIIFQRIDSWWCFFPIQCGVIGWLCMKQNVLIIVIFYLTVSISSLVSSLH